MRTAEFVSPGHPDKICDQISDAILDEYLRKDPNSRVAIEVMAGHDGIDVRGEVSKYRRNIETKKIADRLAPGLGYYENIFSQSQDIAKGVDEGGAGDQGIMIGYACNETESLMPLEYELARDLCRTIYKKWPRDGKTQVSVDNAGKIVSVVASWHGVDSQELHGMIGAWIVHRKIDVVDGFHVFANPAGKWDIGGFDADTGLTGRKIVVDAYGPRVQVGGGAFSGKDPSKVDRSGAYMARKIAVDYLKKYGEKECRVELAYAIGKKEPLQAVAWVDGNPITVTGYDLTPRGIIGFLDLKQPIYEETAKWGHFGNNFPWDI